MMTKKNKSDKLKIKGIPAPRNTPTSPLADTARVNKPHGNDIITIHRSYDFILHPASKHTVIEMLPTPGVSQVKGKVDFLNRVQHANFGISTMDSSFITSEGTIVKEKPKFILCGKPVSGYSPQTINKYLSEQRVGNYKTSAQEIYRARRTLKSKVNSSSGNIKTEDPLVVRIETNGKDENKDDKSVVSYITAPSSASLPTMRSGSHTSFTTFEPKLKHTTNSASGRVKNSIRAILQPRPHTYNVTTEKGNKQGETQRSISEMVTSKTVTYQTPNIAYMMDGAKGAKYAKALMKRGIRNFNNPYRLLKNRERQIIVRTQSLDMKSVEKITKMNNDQSVNKFMLRLPRTQENPYLMEMMLELESGKFARPSSKLSEFRLHKDLDEYMVVRSPSAYSRSQTKSARGRSVTKSNIGDIEEESIWAGNDLDEEVIAIEGK